MAKRVFPILAVSMFTSILGIGIITPFLSLYATEMGASGIWLGIIFTGYGLASSVTNPFGGRLSDRWGRKRFLMIGLFIYSLSSLGYIYAVSAPQLALVRLIQGSAGGLIFPVAMAYVGDISPEGMEGKWMGYATAAFFSGFGIGPLMGGVLNEHFGMNLAFSIMGGLNMVAFLLIAFLLPDIKIKNIAERSRIPFREMSASGVMRGVLSFRFTQAIGRGAFMVFLPIFAASLTLTTTFVGLLVSSYVFSMSLISPFAGRIADRYNRRSLLIISSSIEVVCLALIPLAHNFWQLFILCILPGIGISLSQTTSQALIVEEGRRYGMGTAMALPMVAMGIGTVIGPLICGSLADYVSLKSVFFFVAATGSLGLIMFAWFTRLVGRTMKARVPSKEA